MASAAILDFWNSKILLAIGVERVETHQHAKLRQNRLIDCDDSKIFSYFKWRPRPSSIVEFRKFYWLTVAQTYHFTTFCQNWSFHCGEVAIFRIFKMDAAAILDFWNRKILLIIWVQRMEMHQLDKFRHNRSIGCEDIEIFQFFKMAAVRYLGFVWGIFGLPTVSIWGCLSLCKIWLWSMQ